MHVQPYINFDGRCEEALAFYGRVLGAEVSSLMRFKDAPDQGMIPPGSANRVMHATFRVGDTEMLAMDGRGEGKTNFQGISLALTASNAAEVERVFAGLSDGGKVEMPLGKTFFSPMFGMVRDKFGITWMLLARA